MNKKILVVLPIASLLMASCYQSDNSSSSNQNDYSSNTNNVLPDEVVSLVIKSQPNKLNYLEGETFDPSGLILIATLGDKSIEKVNLEDCEFSVYGPLDKSITSVEITYFEGSVIIPIKVMPNPVIKLEYVHKPYFKDFFVGEHLNVSGLTLKATRQNGKVISNIKDFKVLLDNKYVNKNHVLNVKPGKHQVIVEYFDYSLIYFINVYQGRRIECENIVDTQYLSDKIKNFTEEISSSHPNFGAIQNNKASNNAYLGNLSINDVFRFHIFANEAKNINLVLSASSAEIVSWNNGPFKTKDVYLKDICSIDLNGKTINISDPKYCIKGHTSIYADTSKGDDDICTYWSLCDFGDIALLKGDNTITFDMRNVASFAHINLDCLYLIDANQGGNND